jgi:hypothetical protein
MFSVKVSEKSIGKKKPVRLLSIILVASVALILGAAVPEVWAKPFAETAIFFEFNSTDLDLGIHIFFDAEAWEEVEVKDPDGEEFFEVENDGSLNEIGSTEVFTESAEPQLVEDPDTATPVEIAAAIAAFQARFPVGKYKFRGETVEGARLNGWAMLEHALPGAPEIISPAEAESVNADLPFIVVWSSGDGDAETVRYEVVVEFEAEDGRVFKFVVQVPASGDDPQTMTVPHEFFDSLEGIPGEYKAEVLAIAESRNATITEREFEFEEE